MLSPALAADPQFRERFEREARAVSALDHPNICALYDVGRERLRTNGGGEEDVDFLVMQFLDGETIGKRLERGPLKLDEVLRTAMEIAAALDNAHRAGITHRDLKPGNVMMTASGSKLLDRGSNPNNLELNAGRLIWTGGRVSTKITEIGGEPR